MPYATLKANVDTLLARDDVGAGADIDLIVTIAEADLSRRIYGLSQTKTVELSLNGRTIAAPSDFKSAIALALDQNQDRTITYMTPEVLRNSPAWNSGVSPTYYTIEGDAAGVVSFTVAPAGDPTNPTPLFLSYWTGLASIITAGTNPVFVGAYDIYLFRTLEAAGNYLQEPEIEARYKALADEKIRDYNLAEQRKRFAGNAKVAMNTQRTIV